MRKLVLIVSLAVLLSGKGLFAIEFNGGPVGIPFTGPSINELQLESVVENLRMRGISGVSHSNENGSSLGHDLFSGVKKNYKIKVIFVVPVVETKLVLKNVSAADVAKLGSEIKGRICIKTARSFTDCRTDVCGFSADKKVFFCGLDASSATFNEETQFRLELVNEERDFVTSPVLTAKELSGVGETERVTPPDGDEDAVVGDDPSIDPAVIPPGDVSAEDTGADNDDSEDAGGEGSGFACSLHKNGGALGGEWFLMLGVLGLLMAVRYGRRITLMAIAILSLFSATQEAGARGEYENMEGYLLAAYLQRNCNFPDNYFRAHANNFNWNAIKRDAKQYCPNENYYFLLNSFEPTGEATASGFSANWQPAKAGSTCKENQQLNEVNNRCECKEGFQTSATDASVCEAIAPVPGPACTEDSQCTDGKHCDTELGTCVDPVADPNDGDHDSVADADDNCPAVANPHQEDVDGDEVGDACEPEECKEVPGDPELQGCPDGGVDPSGGVDPNLDSGESCSLSKGSKGGIFAFLPFLLFASLLVIRKRSAPFKSPLTPLCQRGRVSKTVSRKKRRSIRARSRAARA